MKRVYTCFCTDVIHEGHRNIIREAGKYDEALEFSDRRLLK
jgi:glycerol-3-phosphate cytidylyltransferase-like family protein